MVLQVKTKFQNIHYLFPSSHGQVLDVDENLEACREEDFMHVTNTG